MSGKSKTGTKAARDTWRVMFDVLMQTGERRQESLARRNLTPNDSRALHSLDREEGYPIGTLARQWGCDPSTATWVVDRLEREGLAERRPSPADRRVKLVVRTARGNTIMAELLAEFYEPPEALFRLDENELRTLETLLRKMQGDPA